MKCVKIVHNSNASHLSHFMMPHFRSFCPYPSSVVSSIFLNMKKRAPLTAFNTIMNLLARRDHSERELRQKLRRREFSSEEIERALEKARTQNWMADPEKLAERWAEQLHRKSKGIHYINSSLSEKGLPPVARDESLELEKALKLIKNKYSDFSNFSREEKAKAARFLASRGFDSTTVRKVMHYEEEL